MHAYTRSTKVVLAVLLLIGLVISSIVIAFLWHMHRLGVEKSDYTKRTTPLAETVVADLCEKLTLPEDDPRCQPGATVYAPEFLDSIKRYFNKLPAEKANQEEVDRVLGEYFYTRYIWPETKEYSRYYDLRGDHVAIIVVFFEANGTINHIIASVGGS